MRICIRGMNSEKLSASALGMKLLVEEHAQTLLPAHEQIPAVAHGNEASFKKAGEGIGVERRQISQVRQPVVVIGAVAAGAGGERT